MATSKPAHTGAPSAASLRRTIMLSVVVPLVVIQVLLHYGVPPVLTLAIATIFPLIEIGLEFAVTRRVGFISAFALIGIAVGFGLTFITGNGVFAVLKDSAFTFIFGLFFLGSLFTARPLIYRLNLQMVGTDPAARASATTLWERPAVRRSFRLITLVWGLGLLLEAGARTGVAVLLPLATAASLSPIIAIVAFGGLVLWTVRYVKMMRGRAAAVAQS